MRVIGVIDLRDGCAVRAFAGQRDRYQPIGDAVDLARRYVDHYRLAELYVADLDAIESGRHDVVRRFQGREAGGPQRPALLIRQIAGLGVPLWLDAGVSSVDGARQALDLGATQVIVALETLRSFEALGDICATIGGEHVGFSLDLRNGQPIAGEGIARETPEELGIRAADAGVGTVIVIDLARVGTRSGIDFDLLRRVRTAAPRLTLLAGGGVSGHQDLERLADIGCDGALVATALDALYPNATR